MKNKGPYLEQLKGTLRSFIETMTPVHIVLDIDVLKLPVVGERLTLTATLYFSHKGDEKAAGGMLGRGTTIYNPVDRFDPELMLMYAIQRALQEGAERWAEGCREQSQRNEEIRLADAAVKRIAKQASRRERAARRAPSHAARLKAAVERHSVFKCPSCGKYRGVPLYPAVLNSDPPVAEKGHDFTWKCPHCDSLIHEAWNPQHDKFEGELVRVGPPTLDGSEPKPPAQQTKSELEAGWGKGSTGEKVHYFEANKHLSYCGTVSRGKFTTVEQYKDHTIASKELGFCKLCQKRYWKTHPVREKPVYHPSQGGC